MGKTKNCHRFLEIFADQDYLGISTVSASWIEISTAGDFVWFAPWRM